MKIIRIASNDGGGHDNWTIYGKVSVPVGCAVIPADMECVNFPFGNFEVEYIDGVPYMIEDSWTPLPMPEPEPVPEPEVEPDVWDELAEAYRQGVQSAYDE